MNAWCRWALVLVISGSSIPSPAWAAGDPAELIAVVQKVGPQGEGHREAAAAIKELSQQGPETLFVILNAFEGSSSLSANWLLGAWEAIAQRSLEAKTLPAEKLEAFVVDRDNHPGARRIAYEWLLKVDATAADRLIPEMLLDRNAEFRRDAVSRKIVAAQAKLEADDKDAARVLFREALSGAVDDDQIKAVVKPLKELGEQVDLQRHFGFLAQWKLIGPFDNTETRGFDVVYPPERELNFDAKYMGKMGEVAWQPFATEDDYGVVDLAKALAPHKGAITYAAATFNADKAQPAELRLGTPNAWKLWVNGKLVFARDEYHRGHQLDQYRVPIELQAGQNTILLKVCQNEQKEDWAQDWKYQLRVCDSAGAAIVPASSQATSALTPARSQIAVVAQ